MTRESPPPYLSLVVAARNDDHGGNMLQRMQAMLDSWVSQAEALQLSSEIVIVEWNPPADRPRLKQCLRQPLSANFCTIRFLEVPQRIHARFPHSDAIPLHQMIAKNAGVRRAWGEFVLASNLDIIFSAELMQFLAARHLEHGVMYRIDRHDIARELPGWVSVGELLGFCESHTLRVFAREGEFSLSAEGFRQLHDCDIVPEGSGIRFGAGWSELEHSDGLDYRWVESEAALWFQKPPNGAVHLLVDAETGPSAGSKPVQVEIVQPGGDVLASASISGRCRLRLQIPDLIREGALRFRVRGAGLPLTRNPRIVNLRVSSMRWAKSEGEGPQERWALQVLSQDPGFDWSNSFDAASPFADQIKHSRYLHTNACGDFTLLAREDWFALRGYPEFPIWPMHLDSLFCYAAHHAGIREEILREPLRIYHVEHSNAAGWTPEGESARRARLRSKGVSELSYPEAAQWIDVMRRYDAPAIFTGQKWGLGCDALAEEREPVE